MNDLPTPLPLPTRRIKDLRGRRFGRVRVLEYAGCDRHKKSRWHRICDCGKSKVMPGDTLRNGTALSCGCYQKQRAAKANTTHGKSNGPRRSGTAEYRAWKAMKTRCTNPRQKQWSDYGGRGIGVCPAWTDSFDAFLSDVGPKPSPGHSLDRIDVNGDYRPGNVRWATGIEQAANKRGTSP